MCKQLAMELCESWQKILDDLNEEVFDFSFFKEIASKSMNIIAAQIKNETFPKEVAILLIKMARFAEREIYDDEQEIAHYVIYDILYDIETGRFRVDDNNCYHTYKPNAFVEVAINLDTFDLSEMF